ncbi:MAG: peptide chain release factor N(5)-glutamine methyltransferase [Thermodesulfobacteriota bacterium]
MPDPLAIGLVQQRLAARLAEAGIPEPRLEAALLLCHLLGCNRSGLVLRAGDELAADTAARLEELLRRRLAREPLAHLVGEQEFWSLPFAVSSEVLIPRPETEELLEQALAVARQGLPPGLLGDLGVGSGVISVILALELPDRFVVGVDRSLAALRIAQTNCQRHGVAGRVGLINSDWLAALPGGQRFALLVSNPPYIADAALPGLAPEVREYEPRMALISGPDGLEAIRLLAGAARRVLVPGGWLFMEIGADQGEAARNLLASFPEYDSVLVRTDLAGLPRIAQARRC